MGFFSWDCKGCGHSLRSRHATTKTSAWMKQAVVYLKGSKTGLRGEYDGYGRIGGEYSDDDGNFWEGREFTVYHKACHEIMGKPKFDGQSRDAHDQGYFVGEFVDPAKPKTLADLQYMTEVNDAERARAREEWKKIVQEGEQSRAQKAAEEAAVASWVATELGAGAS